MKSDRYQENQVAYEQAKDSNQLREKFFFHWALLAAGTFSLLIPFVQSLDNKITHPALFIVTGIFLILSIITSSLRNFLWAKTTWYWAEINAGIMKHKNVKNIFHKSALALELFSIFSFIIGIILGSIFIYTNLLYVNFSFVEKSKDLEQCQVWERCLK